MSERSILMCSPKYYGVTHKINHQTDLKVKADSILVQSQWHLLKTTLESLGCKVEVMKGQKGWADLVYTANAGLVIGDKKILLSLFKFSKRQGESKFNQLWFENHGWETFQPSHIFEGAGEAFFWKDKLLLGWGFGKYSRSDIDTKHALKRFIPDIPIVDLMLATDQFYHLDLALTPIPSKNIIAYYPGAFSIEARRRIKSLDADLVEVSKEDIEVYGCNAIPVGNNIVMNQKAQILASEFQKRGLNPILLDTSEFEKMGGGPRCMSLDLHYSGPR